MSNVFPDKAMQCFASLSTNPAEPLPLAGLDAGDPISSMIDNCDLRNRIRTRCRPSPLPWSGPLRSISDLADETCYLFNVHRMFSPAKQCFAVLSAKPAEPLPCTRLGTNHPCSSIIHNHCDLWKSTRHYHLHRHDHCARFPILLTRRIICLI